VQSGTQPTPGTTTHAWATGAKVTFAARGATPVAQDDTTPNPMRIRGTSCSVMNWFMSGQPPIKPPLDATIPGVHWS
jgi:hypothetical protein